MTEGTIDLAGDGDHRPGFREAWSHRRWRVLLAATAVSGIGDWLYFTAFAVWLYDRTGSPGWLGAAVTARMLIYLVFGTFGGVVAGRCRRRDLMVVLDLSRAAVMVALTVLVAADGSPVVGIALTCLTSALTVPYRPALAAATPYVVPESTLAAANGAEAVVSQLTVFAGPALAAAIIAVGSASAAVAVNGATFVVAAGLIVGCGDLGGGSAKSPVDPPRVDKAPASSGRRGAWATLADQWTTLMSLPGLLTLNVLVALTVFAFGAEGVLHVLVARDGLGRTTEFVGVLTAAIGVGGLLIAPLSARVAGARDTGRWLIACAVLQGAPLAVLGFVSSPAVAIGLLAVEGAGLILFEVLAITMLQRLARDRVAEMYGIQDSLSAGAQLLGGLAAPVLVAAGGLELACAVAGGAVLGFGVLGAPALMRCGRAADSEAARVAPIADELAALELFAGAERATVEAVSSSITPELVAAGSTVIHEGAAADDLFVIRSGALSVRTARQGTIRLMTAGDLFGEIGVVEQRARTASVVAETDAELWRIPGESFIEAVRVPAGLPDPMRRGIAGRLALTADLAAIRETVLATTPDHRQPHEIVD